MKGFFKVLVQKEIYEDYIVYCYSPIRLTQCHELLVSGIVDKKVKCFITKTFSGKIIHVDTWSSNQLKRDSWYLAYNNENGYGWTWGQENPLTNFHAINQKLANHCVNQILTHYNSIDY